MKRRVYLGVVIVAVILLAIIVSGCSDTFTGTLELTTRETTLEEAASSIGNTVPVPAYLPAGYEIKEIYFDGSYVRVLISDKGVPKKLVTHTDASGTRQRWEIECKMLWSVRWSESGAPPVRLPVEKVKLHENWGFLQDRGDHRALWWNWSPVPSESGMFELILAATKRISKEELVKIAESVKL